MPLEVRPATLADAVKAVIIEGRAYGPNTSSIALFPGPFPDGNLARVEDLQAEREQSAACRWMKVVDTDLEAKGEDGMVAFSLWYVWEGESHLSPRKWGAGSNPEACEQFFGGMKRVWQERFQGRPHVYLKALHTDPDHQRRGAGSLILKWGAAEADRLGFDSYLEASEEGLPLYEKHGYRKVGVFGTDLSKWGGSENYESTLMLRAPIQQ